MVFVVSLSTRVREMAKKHVKWLKANICAILLGKIPICPLKKLFTNSLSSSQQRSGNHYRTVKAVLIPAIADTAQQPKNVTVRSGSATHRHDSTDSGCYSRYGRQRVTAQKCHGEARLCYATINNLGIIGIKNIEHNTIRNTFPLKLRRHKRRDRGAI